MAINSLSYVSHGFSGLASGINTEEMVQKMLMGTQMKLDKAKADKTLLTYKRDIYREINSSLKKFQSDYFSFGSGSKTNMLSSEFYRKVEALSSSDSVKVTATGSAKPGKITINEVTQLAQNLKVQSKASASAEVKGNVNFDNLKDTLELEMEINGISQKLTVDTSKIKTSSDKGTALASAIQEQINSKLGGGITVSAGGTDNKEITFKAEGNRTFSIKGADVSALGLKAGVSNKVDLNRALKDTSIGSKLEGEYFQFSINDKEFTFTGEQSLNDIIHAINTSDAGVKLSYSTLDDKFTMESTVAGKDASIKIKQTAGNLVNAMFGDTAIGKGATIATKPLEAKLDKISADITTESEKTILESVNNATKDGAAMAFEFKIGDETFKAEIKKPTGNGKDKFDTLDEVINALNDATITEKNGQKVTSPTENVKSKIDFAISNGADGKKTITATPTSGKDTKVTLTSGFSSIGFATNATNQPEVKGDTKVKDLGITGTMKFTASDGSQKEVKITENMTVDELNAELKQLEAEIDLKQAPPRFKLVGTKLPIPISIMPASAYKVIFDDDKMKDFVTEDKSNDTVTIGGKGVTNNEIVIQGGKVMQNGVEQTSNWNVTAGQNAVLKINGIDIENNTNTITFDGLTVEVTAKTDAPVTIETKATSTDTFDNIKKFMDDYNNLIDKMWTEVKAKQTYKEYPPLTDEQKKEMTDREIELWEEKSKEGLLRADPTLQAITDAMRDVLNYKPEGSKYSLADLGITTTYDFSKGYGGKLVFSDGSGNTLKEKLANEPDEVEKLFTAKDGIATQMNEVIKAATTPGKPGSKYYNLSLVNISGTSGVPDTKSQLYNQMKDIDKNIKKIENTYKMEYDRYWKQFNAMEKMIQQMNAQSGWLAQQFAV